MVSSKVKNLIIIVLLLVNLSLLAPMAADSADRRSSRQEAINETVAILSERGITVAREADLSSKSLDVCSVTRELEIEKSRVSAILGAVEADDQGGNIIRYYGDKGESVFRGSGDFEILLNDGAVPVPGSQERAARDFAAKLGLDVMEGTGSASVSDKGDSVTVTLTCSARGAKIRNCTVSFTFNSSGLLLVAGARPLDRINRDTAAETLDVPTVLMRFLEIIESEGQVCSQVTDVEMCYSLNSSASGTGTLVPVWRIQTDTGELYINGITGQQDASA